jgi:hypothetical protein
MPMDPGAAALRTTEILAGFRSLAMVGRRDEALIKGRLIIFQILFFEAFCLYPRVYRLTIHRSPAGFSMKLLVVEDERRMLELLRQGLSEEGHRVVCAVDGSEDCRWFATTISML